VHSEINFLETAVRKAQDKNPYVSLLHDEPQDQEREGDVNTSTLAAVVKNVAPGDGATIETEETEETDETEKTVEGRVHSNMVSFDTHTRTKLTIVLLDIASVHGEKEIMMETALQKQKV